MFGAGRGNFPGSTESKLIVESAPQLPLAQRLPDFQGFIVNELYRNIEPGW